MKRVMWFASEDFPGPALRRRLRSLKRHRQTHSSTRTHTHTLNEQLLQEEGFSQTLTQMQSYHDAKADRQTHIFIGTTHTNSHSHTHTSTHTDFLYNQLSGVAFG